MTFVVETLSIARNQAEFARKLLFTLLLLLSAAGVGLSSLLLQEHLNVFSGGLSEGLFCGAVGVWDCNRVAAHPLSMLFQYPVALWGLMYFVFVLWLSTSATIYRGPDRKAFLALGTIVCTLGFLFDLFLGYVMITQIGAVCLNCVAAYSINGVLALVFWRLDRGLAEPVHWSRLLPNVSSLRSDAGYFRFWVKSGVSVLFLCVLGIAWIEGLVPFNRVRGEMIEQIWNFLGRMREEPPDVDMSRFAGQPAIGPSDAQLTIAVAGDFECAYCRSLAASLGSLRKRYPDDLRLIYVNSPLSSKCNPSIPKDIHKNACWLAEAAECAAAQGSFWEFHDELFHNLPFGRIDQETVLSRLERIGLDREAFAACMESSTPRVELSADITLCRDLGMTTTPSLVLNGYLHRGGMMPEVLSELANFLIEPDETNVDAGKNEQVSSLVTGDTQSK